MTALTPAQVREHARALIADAARDCDDGLSISEHLFDHFEGDPPEMDGPTVDALIADIADAIRTARITVDWDEEGT